MKQLNYKPIGGVLLRLYGVVSSFNYRVWKYIFRTDRNSDIDNIWVDSQGNFGMKSKDIFRDKEQSLRTLKKLKESVKNYHSNN